MQGFVKSKKYFFKYSYFLCLYFHPWLRYVEFNFEKTKITSTEAIAAEVPLTVGR